MPKEHPDFYALSLLKIGFVGRLTIVLGVPLIIFFKMFDVFGFVQIAANTNEPQLILSKDVNSELTESVMAEVLQTSLNLSWYDLCFYNDGALKINGRTEFDDYSDDRGEVSFSIWEDQINMKRSPDLKISAKPYEKTCRTINLNNNQISIGSSTLNTGARINDRSEDITMINDNKFSFSFVFHYTDIHIFVKQNKWALLAKLVVILAIWVSLVLLARNTFHFITADKFKR